MKNVVLSLIIICFAALPFSAKAEAHVDFAYIKTDTNLSEVKRYIGIMDFFSKGEIDSLLTAVNNTTSVIPSDTLRKFYQIFQSGYNASPGLMNYFKKDIQTIITDSNFRIERVYAGRDMEELLNVSAPQLSNFQVLRMTEWLSYKDNKLVISKISFRIEIIPEYHLAPLIDFESAQKVYFKPEEINKQFILSQPGSLPDPTQHKIINGRPDFVPAPPPVPTHNFPPPPLPPHL